MNQLKKLVGLYRETYLLIGVGGLTVSLPLIGLFRLSIFKDGPVAPYLHWLQFGLNGLLIASVLLIGAGLWLFTFRR